MIAVITEYGAIYRKPPRITKHKTEAAAQEFIEESLRCCPDILSCRILLEDKEVIAEGKGKATR